MHGVRSRRVNKLHTATNAAPDPANPDEHGVSTEPFSLVVPEAFVPFAYDFRHAPASIPSCCGAGGRPML